MSSASSSHAHPVIIEEVITTVIMARVTEFFGFFVYAIASVLVFPRLFFPEYDAVTGGLLSFAVFSLAFIARPIADLISVPLEKEIGQAARISIALMIFGSATVAIGMLPGHQTIGWVAPFMLVVLRILQGIGLGLASDGITIQLQISAREGRTGLFDMVPQIGGPIGFIVAAALFYVLTGFLTDEEFINWGWRFAFFAVMAVNVVSLFARLRLLNTDFGARIDTLKTTPVGELLDKQLRTILLSTFIPLASYALFHIVTIFPIGYALLFSKDSISDILMYQMIGGGLAIVTVMISGALADRFLKRRVIGISTVLITLLCFTIGTLNYMPSVFIIFGFILLGLSFGQAGSIVPKRFQEKYRYSGSALATNLSWITGAAFAPLVALFLVSTFGLWAASLYLLSGVIVTIIALIKLEAHKDG